MDYLASIFANDITRNSTCADIAFHQCFNLGKGGLVNLPILSTKGSRSWGLSVATCPRGPRDPLSSGHEPTRPKDEFKVATPFKYNISKL